MKRITVALLSLGTLLCCQYAHTLAAVILLICFIGIIAVMWVRFYAEVLRDEAEEEICRRAEEQYRKMIADTEYHVEYRQYVGLGKGFDK